MANRYGFLIDTVAGGSKLDLNSNEFDVRGYAVRLVLGGAINGDVVQVEVLAGNGEASPNGTWAALAYNGTSIQLTNTNTQFVLVVEGRYRVTYGGASTQLQVYMEEDTIGIDQRTIAMFPTANNAGAAGATGPSGLATIPFSDEVASFGVASTSHGYRVTTATTATATLPAATSAVGCVYIIEAEGAGVVTVATSGGDLINGTFSTYIVQTGQALIFYSNGIDGYSLTPDFASQIGGVAVTDPVVSGGSTNLGVFPSALISNIFKSVADMAAYTLSIPDGLYQGQSQLIVFNHNVTALTLSGANWGTAGLAMPTAMTANVPFWVSWDIVTSKWVRIQ